MSHEIRSLTGLRGVASLYVVLFHYLLGLSFTNHLTTILAHGYLSVDLFFVLSGFVMALTYRNMFADGARSPGNYRRFLGRRIARVYPLYLAMTLVAVCLALAGAIEAPGMPMWSAFLMNLLMVQSWGLGWSLDPPAWSISAEWAAYLLFPVLLMPCLFWRPAWAWLSAAACVVVLALLTAVPFQWEVRANPQALLDVSDPFLALPVLRCLAGFALGLVTFRLTLGKARLGFLRRRWSAAAVGLVIVGLLAFARTDLLVVLLFPALIFSLAVGGQSLGTLLGSPVMELLGRLSYSIYLIHYLMTPVVGWVHGVAASHGVAHAQTYGSVVAVVLTFGCSWLAYRLIELPGRHALRTLFEGPAQQPGWAAVPRSGSYH